MGFENVCIACLATEVKMYSLNELSIIAYTNLTGITCIDDSENLCFECMFVLSKVEQFRINCLRAYETLTSSEHSLDNITQNHEPKLKLTEPMVLYVGPDHIELSDSDDDDVEKAKPFNSNTHIDLKYLIQKHGIKSDAGNDTKVQTCNQGLDFDDKKIHISSLEVEQGVIIIDPCIRESKIESNNAKANDKSESEIDDFTYYDIETQDTSNIEEKISHPQNNGKSRSGSKLGGSKPTVKKQLKVPKKNKVFADNDKKIRAIMSVTALSPEDARKEIELRNQCHNYIKSTFKCDLCYTVFSRQKSLSNHMKKHNSDWLYECDYCHLRGKSKSVIERHILGSHTYKFTCKRCPFVCFARKQAKTHTRQHKGKTCRKHPQNNGKSRSGSKLGSEIMTITTLSPEGARKEIELRKQSRSYINNTQKCDLCFKAFNYQRTLSNHMKKHNNEYGEFECDYCHVRAKSRRRIKHHIYVCHTQKFSCKVCRYVCFSRSQAISHIRRHEGRKYECKYCKKIFLQPNTLSVHMRQAHITQQNEIVCELCGDVFISKAGLNGHKKIVHRQESNSAAGPACSECDVHFSSHTAYRRHLVLSKKHTVSHGCTECGATFPDRHELRVHHRTQHPRAAPRRPARDPAPSFSPWRKLPARCPEFQCPVIITERKQYRKHMITAHPDSRAAKIFDQPAQYVCELCGLGFRLHCYLRYHMSEHTGERPYSCAECEQRFCGPGALQRHRASHNPNPNPKVPCDLCDKTFTVANLERHRRNVHLGIRPHKCEMCDKAFHDYCHLKLHIRHTHGKVPWPIPNRKTKRTPKKKNVKSSKISRECDESEASSDSQSS